MFGTAASEDPQSGVGIVAAKSAETVALQCSADLKQIWQGREQYLPCSAQSFLIFDFLVKLLFIRSEMNNKGMIST